MALGASRPGYSAGGVDELQRENAELREQLRRLSTAQVVAQGAVQEAEHEKEATMRMAGAVTAEERATRTVVEGQSGSLGLSVVLQILSFFVLLIILFGMFAWMPGEISRRASPTTVIGSPVPGVTTVRP